MFAQALPTVAFLGATGDSAGNALAATLKAGHTATALARTPSKLTTSMTAKGVSETTLRKLTIVDGNVKDPASVRKILTINGKPVDIIVSGIGSLPQLQWNLLRPVTLNDPTICADATDSLLKALAELKPTTKPLLIVISTTGIAPAGRPLDVPIAYLPLYRWLLHVPHVDKEQMESKLRDATSRPDSERPIRGFVAVKPTLLVDGPAITSDKVRAASEEKPAIGWTISRETVGKWIYDKLIAEPVKPEWIGKGVSITS